LKTRTRRERRQEGDEGNGECGDDSMRRKKRKET
jgi:hypothetical protein